MSEIVFSDDQTRTIFGNYVDFLAKPRKWNIPKKVDISRAEIACIDPPFHEESALAARYAVESGVPFVSIDCKPDHPLCRDASAIIISGEFRGTQYAGVELQELFAEYAGYSRGLVVFTVGDEPILYGRRGMPVRTFSPYRVRVVDSAGAGDSFRAGLIYGIRKSWSDERIIAYASAVAAIVCERFPGVRRSPSHAEVTRFMSAASS